MKKLLSYAALLAALAFACPRLAVAITLVVDDAADPFPITGTMTLRQALMIVNTIPGQSHHITFQIPGPGPFYIFPTSELPAIQVDSVWVDGYSQPGATPGIAPPATAKLQIILDGNNAGIAHGLIVLSSYNRIEGLCVERFARDGIRIQGMPPPGTKRNLVQANFVGTDYTGMLFAGNGWAGGSIWAGVDVLCTPSEMVCYCDSNTVTANLISGNVRCGVQISSCPPSDCWGNHVLSNLIGTDVTGKMALGNMGSGVVLAEGTHDNDVQNNVVSANNANGMDLTGNFYTQPPAYTQHNHFVSNLIGVDVNGSGALGNGGRGVSLGIFEINSFYGGFCPENRFDLNVVAYNGLDGFCVWEHPLNAFNDDGNVFFRNSTYDNAGLAIDLDDDGMTPNDPGDLDTGANQDLNFPLIMSALYTYGTTQISGIAAPSSQVHVFKGKASVLGGDIEGMQWLGSVWPNPAGNWTLIVAGLSSGDPVVALAMDWTLVSLYCNTSEFCPAVAVQCLGGVTEGAVAFGLSVTGANPFRSRVAFSYGLPASGPVRLSVHDVSGATVRVLAGGTANPGTYTAVWDGTDARGRAVPPGVYFVQLRSGAQQAIRRVIKLR